jgi:hypothetical protein
MLISHLDKDDLHTTLVDYYWIITREDVIKEKRKEINDKYQPRRLRLDNVECRYLHQQLQHIQSQLENGTKCVLSDSKLQALQKTLTKRYEELGRTTGLTNSINTMWSAHTDMITTRLAEMRKLVEEI